MNFSEYAMMIEKKMSPDDLKKARIARKKREKTAEFKNAQKLKSKCEKRGIKDGYSCKSDGTISKIDKKRAKSARKGKKK